MLTVYKYPLSLNDVTSVDMPQGAEVLFVATQGNKLCLWARVNPDSTSEERRFRIAGTGHPLKSDVRRHLGSFMLMEGSLVFHVFELDKEVE